VKACVAQGGWSGETEAVTVAVPGGSAGGREQNPGAAPQPTGRSAELNPNRVPDGDGSSCMAPGISTSRPLTPPGPQWGSQIPLGPDLRSGLRAAHEILD